jgi:hypothetical protein
MAEQVFVATGGAGAGAPQAFVVAPTLQLWSPFPTQVLAPTTGVQLFGVAVLQHLACACEGVKVSTKPNAPPAITNRMKRRRLILGLAAPAGSAADSFVSCPWFFPSSGFSCSDFSIGISPF